MKPLSYKIGEWCTNITFIASIIFLFLDKVDIAIYFMLSTILTEMGNFYRDYQWNKTR